ncbi:hypothetical protein GCM10011349_12740 [Novosphingobium indicum]|uniref:DUF2267 domain-containing protein n=1 Tax=Novosphingobium indicum TaxID=462949 RepID=A0ABQ2JHG5_9SPHN|nr:DUF2267 domain-containing protein [Novosphingobium indicum]GGN46047.1 hypothetical protein GCM10011349_12740 [Novosphingobium indicum]
MTTGSRHIDHAVHQARLWLGDLDAELGDVDQAHTYALLRAVLHVLRDRLPPAEAIQFGGQLPNLIRGIYYEGWRFQSHPTRLHSMIEFVEAVMAAIAPTKLRHPRRAVEAALAVVGRHVSSGEIEDIRSCLPEDIRASWPQATSSTRTSS